MTWRIDNSGADPASVTRETAGVPFEPNLVSPYRSRSASVVIEGPSTDRQLSNTVDLEIGGRVLELNATVNVPACEGPGLPPEVTFTFTKTPSVAAASVGQRVGYTYCGQNTSEIPLEVVRLADDRLGVLIERPSVATVVQPGDTLCSSDTGDVIGYTIQPSDAGTTLVNNSVVTVRTLEDEPREFQATAQATVLVPVRRLRGNEDNTNNVAYWCGSESAGRKYESLGHVVRHPCAAVRTEVESARAQGRLDGHRVWRRQRRADPQSRRRPELPALHWQGHQPCHLVHAAGGDADHVDHHVIDLDDDLNDHDLNDHLDVDDFVNDVDDHHDVDDLAIDVDDHVDDEPRRPTSSQTSTTTTEPDDHRPRRPSRRNDRRRPTTETTTTTTTEPETTTTESSTTTTTEPTTTTTESSTTTTTEPERRRRPSPTTTTTEPETTTTESSTTTTTEPETTTTTTTT